MSSCKTVKLVFSGSEGVYFRKKKFKMKVVIMRGLLDASADIVVREQEDDEPSGSFIRCRYRPATCIGASPRSMICGDAHDYIDEHVRHHVQQVVIFN